MPTYEYRCRECEHKFERFQKMTEDPIRECPQCGAPEAERMISPGGGLIFKGPGFYATDYRDSPGSGATGEEGAAPSSDGESGEGADGASTDSSAGAND